MNQSEPTFVPEDFISATNYGPVKQAFQVKRSKKPSSFKMIAMTAILVVVMFPFKQI